MSGLVASFLNTPLQRLVSLGAGLESAALTFLVNQRRETKVDRNETEKILRKSIEIMTDKYQSYLDNAVKNIKKDFASLL